MFAQDLVGAEEITVRLSLQSLLDNYGYPAINDDGTFYPTDKFELTYHIKTASSIIFEKVNLNYEPTVFSLINNEEFSSQTGWGAFEISSSTIAGTYPLGVEVWGHRFSETHSYVLTSATLPIQVVLYEPHFTPTLAYTIPTGNSSSDSSFDRPFALIIRYDGNGPNQTLTQRAIIDDYLWDGYAQKIPPPNTLHQTPTPNLTLTNIFHQNATTQFIAPNIATQTNQPPLIVDGESIQANELPKTLNWQTNTNHTYTWTQTLTPTNPTHPSPTKPQPDEWFTWQFSLVFPPAPNQITPQQNNQTLNQDEIANQLIQQLNSPTGTLTTTPIGNTAIAVYAHNKLIEKFAQTTQINKNQTLQCTTQTPLYFNAQKQYAKIHYLLNPTVAKEITTQNFTTALHYNITLGTTQFGKPTYFETNFTTPYEFYDKPLNITAYQWNPTHQTWTTDPTVNIETRFESAFNYTETDIQLWKLEEQTTDQTALKLAQTDLYDSGVQTFLGTGTIEANLKRTSPLYYNLYVEAKQTQKITLQRTIQINFQDNQPYNLPLNLDPTSPLPVSIIADNAQTAMLLLDAPKELGGLTKLTIHQITQIPPEKNPTQTPKNQLNLKLLKTLNLTQPQTTQPPLHYDLQTAQYPQYYPDYSSAFNEALGFCGQTQIALPKNQNLTPLTDQNQALLYIEATNIWNTTFHKILLIQPYTKPQWEIPLNQAATYLLIIIILTIIVSFVICAIRAKQ